MGELRKLSLLEETEREAREIEKELEAHPELDDIEVTDEMDAALFAKIQAYEKNREKMKEDDSVEFSEEIMPEIKEAEEKPKKIPYRKKRKKYIIVALAAVLVLVLGTGLVGVGNKAYWKELFDQGYGEEELKVIQVEDMDDLYSEDEENGTVYHEIEEEIGVTVVKLRYMPKEMFFSSMDIIENMQQAMIFYEYEGEIIRYTIYLNSTDSSSSENIQDKKVNEYIVFPKEADIEVKVEEYQVPNYKEYRRSVHVETVCLLERKH